MNKTIKAKYTDDEQLLIFFAKAKGWREQVEARHEDGSYETNEDGSIKMIDNTEETYEQFISNWATEMLKQQIGEPAKREVQRVFREQERAEQERIAKELESKLEITVE